MIGSHLPVRRNLEGPGFGWALAVLWLWHLRRLDLGHLGGRHLGNLDLWNFWRELLRFVGHQHSLPFMHVQAESSVLFGIELTLSTAFQRATLSARQESLVLCRHNPAVHLGQPPAKGWFVRQLDLLFIGLQDPVEDASVVSLGFAALEDFVEHVLWNPPLTHAQVLPTFALHTPPP